jgi:hypothetical protein
LHGVVLTRPPGVSTDGHAPTLEAAKAEFGARWKRWLEWAKLGEDKYNFSAPRASLGVSVKAA